MKQAVLSPIKSAILTTGCSANYNKLWMQVAGLYSGNPVSLYGSGIRKGINEWRKQSVVKSDKYPECKERYRRLKACRGHKRAIIAICRTILIAIWHILPDGETYSSEGYFTERPTSQTQVLTTQKALNLLKSRGFTIKDDSSLSTG